MKGVHNLMKKTLTKIIALFAVATMIFAFASCTQTVNVRLVDKAGEDLDLKGIFGGGNNSGNSGNNGNTDTPSATLPGGNTNVSTTAASETPTSSGTPATSANPSTDGAGQTAAPPAGTDAPPASNVPASKAEILDFYKNAVARVKNNGEAGYNKKEWQSLGALEGFGGAQSIIQGIIDNYMTPEGEAKVQNNAKGSNEAKDRFPEFTLTDYSKITDASLTKNAAGNYEIKMTLASEDTPTKDNNFIGKATNSVLWWEDIEKELKNISAIKSYENIHVIYDGIVITAEITPAGNFVSMKHYVPIKINIGSVKIIAFTLKDKSATLENFATYTDFAY